MDFILKVPLLFAKIPLHVEVVFCCFKFFYDTIQAQKEDYISRNFDSFQKKKQKKKKILGLFSENIVIKKSLCASQEKCKLYLFIYGL